jgi:hypothetical protein
MFLAVLDPVHQFGETQLVIEEPDNPYENSRVERQVSSQPEKEEGRPDWIALPR